MKCETFKKKSFLIRGLVDEEIIQFPVWIIPFPVWLILFPVWIIPFPVRIIAFPVMKINFEPLGSKEKQEVF